ncbi:MAG: hypothetical protein AAF798_05275 [Bacteroidota bacterium]
MMTAQQVKTEISKILDSLNEETLIQVFEYLQLFKETFEEDKSLANNLNKILKEDIEVLEKLAQ